MSVEILSVRELSVSYGGTAAVRGVNLSVEAGSVKGILGANGAGKTSTLMGIHRMIQGVKGQVVFDGRDLSWATTREAVAAGIALCPQNRRLFPNMSIEDNLLLGAYACPQRLARQRLDEAYDRTPWIGERRNEAAGRLSGGQQQSVAIARSLMSAPTLLMLDEPSSGLSPVAINEVCETLRAIVESGVTILLVEQNVHLVRELCASVYVLAAGEIAAHGSIDELTAGDALSAAYLG